MLDGTGEAISSAPPPADVPDPAAFDRRIRRHALLEGWLVVEVEREPRAVLERLVHWEGLGPVRFVVAVSGDVDLGDLTSTIWGIFTRFDPARDMIFQEQSFVGARPLQRGRIGIDATWKEGYPPPVTVPDEVQALVERRWGEYFGDRLERRERGRW